MTFVKSAFVELKNGAEEGESDSVLKNSLNRHDSIRTHSKMEKVEVFV